MAILIGIYQVEKKWKKCIGIYNLKVSVDFQIILIIGHHRRIVLTTLGTCTSAVGLLPAAATAVAAKTSIPR